MRRALLVLVVGWLALVLQGGIATFLPPPYCPDLSLLVVIALGLRWQNFATGMLITVALGYATDLLSGSLFGQHALLRLLVFSGSRLASRQLNLRGALPLSVFAAATTVLYAFGLVAITSFFDAGAGSGLSWLQDSIPHALVNAICAAGISSGLERMLALSGEDEAGRRPLRLESSGSSS